MIKADEFELKQVDDFTQGMVEDWVMETEQFAGDKAIAELPLTVYRRVLVDAAAKSEWYAKKPEAFDSARDLHPSVVARLFDEIIATHKAITEPDENFTEPQ